MHSEAIAHVRNSGEDFPLSSGCIPMPFRNEHFEGSIVFVDRQQEKRQPSLRRQAGFEDHLGHWEIQVQGRFLTPPSGTVSCGAHLPQMQFGMGSVVKSMLALSGHSVQRSRDDRTDFISLPMNESARLYRSMKPIELPIAHPDCRGTWEWFGTCETGRWHSVKWRQACFDTCHYYAFSFSSPYIDWKLWKATRVPAVGSFDLAKLWGSQDCVFKLIDGIGTNFVEVQFLPPCVRQHYEAKVVHQCLEESIASDVSTQFESEFDIASRASSTREVEWHGCDCECDAVESIPCEVVAHVPASAYTHRPNTPLPHIIKL